MFADFSGSERQALGSGPTFSHFRLQISDLRLCYARIYFFRCWNLASDALYPLSFNSSSEIQLGVGQRAGLGPVRTGRPGSAQEINLMFCIRTSFRHAHPQQRALWHRRVRQCLAAMILSGWVCSLSMPLLAQGNDTGAPASAAEVRELRALVEELQARDARMECELRALKAQIRQSGYADFVEDGEGIGGPHASMESAPQAAVA